MKLGYEAKDNEKLGYCRCSCSWNGMIVLWGSRQVMCLALLLLRPSQLTFSICGVARCTQTTFLSVRPLSGKDLRAKKIFLLPWLPLPTTLSVQGYKVKEKQNKTMTSAALVFSLKHPKLLWCWKCGELDWDSVEFDRSCWHFESFLCLGWHIILMSTMILWK